MPKMEKKERLEGKRAAFQETRKKHGSRWAILVCAVLLAGGLIYYLQLKPSSTERAPVAGTSSGSSLILPVSAFDDGKARFFNQKDGKIEIRYFVIKSSDGIIRAAFDACDVCWRAGKGYVQEGDNMVCRNCGRRFASASVNEVQGGCNPAPLVRSVQDGNLIIKAEDIRQGKGYFDLGRKG